jgi:hypothetical protein
MDPDPELGELRDRGAHIHGAAAKAIELGDHQHVAGLQPVEQAGEAAPLRGGNVSGHRLGDDAPEFYLEAGCRDLLKLVVRCLTGR